MSHSSSLRVKSLASENQYLYPVNPSVNTSRERRTHFKIQTRQNKLTFQQCLHWAVMLILFFVLIQATRSIISGVYQFKALHTNMPVVQKYQQEMAAENDLLNEKIKMYSSPEGIEELARSSLNMVGKNEVLVVIQ